VDQLYERGKAVNMAAHFEIDAVIDPVETRAWIRSAIV
jgi:acetyl-CoA carboxylase carboxyltransferase component